MAGAEPPWRCACGKLNYAWRKTCRIPGCSSTLSELRVSRNALDRALEDALETRRLPPFRGQPAPPAPPSPLESWSAVAGAPDKARRAAPRRRGGVVRAVEAESPPRGRQQAGTGGRAAASSLILGWLRQGSAGGRRRPAVAADSLAAPKAKRGPADPSPDARPAKSSRGRPAPAPAHAGGRRNSLDVPGVTAARPATSRAVNALRTGVLEAASCRQTSGAPRSNSDTEVEEEDRPRESEDEYQPSASPALARRPPGRPLGPRTTPPAESTSEPEGECEDESEDDDPAPEEPSEDEDDPPLETPRPARPPDPVPRRPSPGDVDSADSTASAPAAASAERAPPGQTRQLQPASPPPRQMSSPTIDAPTNDASALERPASAKDQASGSPAAELASSLSFKERICDRLRSLCRGHEEAAVLADYVATLAEARRNWEEELAVELKKVFKTTVQAQAFISWVRALKATNTPKAAEGGASREADGDALARSPQLAQLPASAPKPREAARLPGTNKNELLKSMTQQLQLILTKLNDKSITDDTKEKYQTLAHSIKTQMAKITTQPQAKGAKAKGPVGRDAPLSRAPRKIQW